MQVSPEQIFDTQQATVCDPEALVRQIAELVAHIQDTQEKFRVAEEYMHARSREPLPEVERFPIHFYEDGIRSLETALKMRQIIAFQHFLGNTGYSRYDVIQEMVKGIK
jgi:hypothetical protein